jgi:hypothetical protein
MIAFNTCPKPLCTGCLPKVVGRDLPVQEVSAEVRTWKSSGCKLVQGFSIHTCESTAAVVLSFNHATLTAMDFYSMHIYKGGRRLPVQSAVHITGLARSPLNLLILLKPLVAHLMQILALLTYSLASTDIGSAETPMG